MSYEQICLFATDLDGTLFSSFGQLSDMAADTLRRLRSRGIKVVISTGRPFYSVRNAIPEDLYDYASCMNGQDIYVTATKEHILLPELTKEDIHDLYSLFSRYPLILNAASQERSVYICSAWMTALIRLRDFPRNVYRFLRHRPFVQRDVTDDRSILDHMPVAKLCFSGSNRFLRRFANHLDPDRYSCFFVNACWLEIMSAGISKGEALKIILQREHLNKENAAAIGDGENDLPLLNAAGLKIAMKNAMPAVKQAADETAGSFLEDGCARWIRDHLL